jgi:ankyrin repeat protein
MGAIGLVKELLRGDPASAVKQVHLHDAHAATPLLLAAQHGHDTLIQVMLQRCATPPPLLPTTIDITAPPDPCPVPSTDLASKSALQLLADERHLVPAAWLASFYMDGRLRAAGPGSVGAVDSRGFSALHSACAANSLPLVRLLLLCGANPTLPALDGSTPLHSLASHGPSSDPKIVHALLRFAQLDTSIASTTDGKNNPLHVAAYTGAAAAIKPLISACAIDEQNASGYTPIVLGIQMSQVESVRMLIQCGADVNVTPTYKCAPPLLFAAQNNHTALVQALLDAGADPNKPTDSQQTALYRAASLNNETTVRALLDKGADVNSVDKDGSTALHIAANNNCFKVVALLLEHGANPSDRTCNGHAPIHYAAGHGNLDMAVALVDAGAAFRERSVKGSIDVVSALVLSKKCKASASVITGRLKTVELLRNRRQNLTTVPEELCGQSAAPDVAALGEIADRNFQELLQEVACDEQRQVEKKQKERVKRKKLKQKAKLERSGGLEAGDGEAGSEADGDASANGGSRAVSVVDVPELEEQADQPLGSVTNSAVERLPEVDFDAWSVAGHAGDKAHDLTVAKAAAGRGRQLIAPRPGQIDVPPAGMQTVGKKKRGKKGKGGKPAAPVDAPLSAVDKIRENLAAKAVFPPRQNAPVPAAQVAAVLRRVPAPAAKGSKITAKVASTGVQDIPAIRAGMRPEQAEGTITMPLPLVLDDASFPQLGATLQPPKPSVHQNAARAEPPASVAEHSGKLADPWSKFRAPAGALQASAPFAAAFLSTEWDSFTCTPSCLQLGPSCSALPRSSENEASCPAATASTKPDPRNPLDKINHLPSLFPPLLFDAASCPAHGPAQLPLTASCHPFAPAVSQGGTDTMSKRMVAGAAQSPARIPSCNSTWQSNAAVETTGQPAEPNAGQVGASRARAAADAAADVRSCHPCPADLFSNALGWDIWGPSVRAPGQVAARDVVLHDVQLWELSATQRAEALKQAWVCPLTKDLLRDPVFSTAWTVYEREALLEQQRMGHLGERFSCEHSGLRGEICAQLDAWGVYPRR